MIGCKIGPFLVLFIPALTPQNCMTDQAELGAEIKFETHSFVLMRVFAF